MKVIKRGIPPGEEWYETTCTICRSVLQMQLKEVKYERGAYYENSSYTYKCCVCEKTITTDQNFFKLVRDRSYSDYRD